MSWPRTRGAEGVQAARERLIDLVLPAGRKMDGDRAIAIRQAIDLLERAAFRDGQRGELEPAAPYQPVTPAELAEVMRAIEEHHRSPIILKGPPL